MKFHRQAAECIKSLPMADVVVLRVRVIHTEGALVGRDIVPKREVQFELPIPFPGDGRDRVVRGGT